MKFSVLGSFEHVASQVAFWPLNEQHEGKNLLGDRSYANNVVLNGVSYGSNSNEWPSNPVRFSARSDSYGEISGKVGVESGSSFSWMGALFRHSSGDGPLFEWDNESTLSTHIWIWHNKLYMHLYFRNGECKTEVSHDEEVSNNHQHILAASFDSETNQISLYMNGTPKTVLSACTGDQVSFGPNASINRR